MNQRPISAYDQERTTQIQEARAREGQIGTRPGYLRRDVKKPSTPRAPKKLSGHDAILKDMQARACTVEIFLLNSEPLQGVIVASDKFVISLSDGKRTHHIYKHGIESFAEIAPRFDAEPDAHQKMKALAN